MNFSYFYQSPVGSLCITANDATVVSVEFVTGTNVVSADNVSSVIRTCISQLDAYFLGKLRQFTVPLHIEGTTFRQSVWQELLSIPYGKTLSYKEMAVHLGDKNKARAVGLACNKNPLAIIVPCHRVVGQNGALTGYAGGLDKKQWLLQHERG